MNLKKLFSLLSLALACTLPLPAQQPAPTSGDVTVRLAGPIDFATARPLQVVTGSVTSSTNPAIPPGSGAVLQLQNRDPSSFTLKLLRIVVPRQPPFKTMSQAGVAVNGPPASGPHASLAAGALVKFTLTQADGTPGTPIQPTPAPRSTAQSGGASGGSAVSATLKHQMEFEGVALGMTLPEVQARRQRRTAAECIGRKAAILR